MNETIYYLRQFNVVNNKYHFKIHFGFSIGMEYYGVTFIGVGVCSKHFYSYLFSSYWKFMSKIAVGQL